MTKQMDTFSAAMIADGEWDMTPFAPSEENYVAAFQHLIDTGIDAGECRMAGAA